MVSRISRSRLVATVDNFKAKISKYRISEPLTSREFSNVIKGLSPSTKVNCARTSVSSHQAPHVVTSANSESTETSDDLKTAHLFEIATVDAYNQQLPKTLRIDDDPGDSIYAVDSGSLSVARLPTIVTEHPAMYAMPMSAVVGNRSIPPPHHVMRLQIGLIHHRGVPFKHPLAGLYPPYKLAFGLLQNRKQRVLTAEPLNLGSKPSKRDSSTLKISPLAREAEPELSGPIATSGDAYLAPNLPVRGVPDSAFGGSADRGLQPPEYTIEIGDVSNVGFTPINKSLNHSGNQLLDDPAQFGSRGIYDFLPSEKEINERVSEYFAKFAKSNGNSSRSYSGISRVGPPRTISHANLNILTRPSPLIAFRQARGAQRVMEIANNAERVTRSYTEGSAVYGGDSEGQTVFSSYKILPGMPIAVDAFSRGKIPGVTAYFLTHAHSDHYTKLGRTWDNGPIYCSVTTGNLIKHLLNVDPKWVKPLPYDQAIEIPNTGGVKVTLIEANHCPGSCMFVFSGKQTIDTGGSPVDLSVGSDRTFTYLHCGDFRACPAHAMHPAIRGKKLDAVYIDTTYLDPKYCFPPQAMVIDACAKGAKRLVQGYKILQGQRKHADLSPTGSSSRLGQKALVVIGTYTIGKERLIKAVAKALSSKIWCDSRKRAVLLCQDDVELHAMLTDDPTAAQVHVLALGQVKIATLKDHLALHQAHFNRILAIQPTGWAYKPAPDQNLEPTIDQVLAQTQLQKYGSSDFRPQWNFHPQIKIYGVPYSEHSSFEELTCFALSIDWVRIIATVHLRSEEKLQEMQAWFNKWGDSRRDRAGEMVKYRSVDYW